MRLAQTILATVAFLYALQWGRDFLVPLLLGILLAYTLNPLVGWLERLHIRRAFGTTIVTCAILFGMAVTAEKVHLEFSNIIEELPEAGRKLSRLVASTTNAKDSTLRRIQDVATQIEQATAGKPSAPARKPVALLTQEGSHIKVIDWVWAGSRGLLAFLSQATMVVFLVFFLLLSGDTFKRKLVKLAGPSLSRKKVTVHILDEINSSIQGYMFMLLVTNVLLALLMWLALHALGLENAGAWAIVAGLLHLMPYFGPLLIACALGVAAYLQAESLQLVLLVVLASIAIATLVGTGIATWMTGRIARMNAAAVFVSLLFWGWLWGVWGLLLGVPLVVILKVVAEKVEGLEVVAELLGE
ncbi:AI-2E family transporter [Pseudoduganella sp. DS3]|uniref:AI-2E family transporter n=1 Tax=Pseudoduganella guangdongensis TaxID=2692179 RepID=A0A6N9HGA1_9BURK|nr:AI-2E family transporter [Pseudoduganella guangdongensis]MYN02052.1 AI-2E family transporter [Pseudoduganella guangdongensis]